MSTNKTKNLGLHSWVREDRFLMDEFNENFDAIDKAVGGKAEQDALDALAGRVDKKAEQTALDAETAARKALAAQVSNLDASRLRFIYGVHPGDGGATVRLDFDFKPLLVIVSTTNNYSRGGYPWIRGATQGLAYGPDSTRAVVNLTWEDRAVQWSIYNPTSYSTPNDWLNAVGFSYPYFAVGIVE